MNSLLRVVSCLSVLFASLLLVGTPPAAADTVLESGQALPLSSYAAHVVDEARGRIYITAGPGDDRLAVTDLQGRPIQTVDGLTGASSMALSDDGTSLFVALETHRVVRLDAETLTVAQTYELADLQRVIDLAWAGDRLWVAARSSCCADTVYSLDPATDERRPVTGLQGSDPSLASTANGHLLVLMGYDPTSNEKVFLVDSGSGAVLTTRVIENNPVGVGTSSTGQPYVLTDRVGYRLVSLDPDTLATTRSTGLASTSAVDTDGSVAVSSTGNSSLARGVDVRDAQTSSQLNRYRLSDVSDDFPLVLSTVLTSAGLVVLHRGAAPVVASFVSDPSAPSSNITLAPAPPEAYVGRETTLTGTLTDRGAPVAGAEVRIVDQPGVAGNGEPMRTRTVTTAGDGTFSFPYTPRTWNDVITYEYAGDDVHAAAWQQARSNFALQPTDLALDYPRTPAPSEPITFTGTLTALGEPIPGAEIEVEQWCSFAEPFTIRTDESGHFELTATPARCKEEQFSFFYEGSWTYESLWTVRQVQPTWATSDTTVVQPVEDAPVGSTWDWTGTVTSAGAAAPDVPVTYTIWRDFPNTKVVSGTTRTDDSGGFHIVETFDPPGIYTLIADYDGDATTLGSSDSDQFEVTRFPTTLTMDDADIGALPDQAITIGGRVTTADGTPLADHPIEIAQNGSVLAPLRTDADGRFEFQTVPRPPQGPNDQTRMYDVDVVQDARYANAHARVWVTVAPEQARLVLDDVPTRSAIGDEVSLSGRLTTGTGEPLAGQEVVLAHQDGEVETLRAVTDDQGRFSVNTVIRTGQDQFLTASFAGTRTYLASSSTAHWYSTPLPGVLTLDKVPTLLLGESFSLTGRLTDADGNGESTWLDFSRTNEAGQTDWTRSRRTAADGSFSLPVEIGQVGRYTFLVQSELWRVEQQTKRIVVEVRRLRLTTTALRPVAVKQDWSVYDAARDPVVRTSSNPARSGLCVAHEVQRLVNGAWRPVTTTECRDTNDAGTLSQRIDVRHPAGSRFRIRAVRESATKTVGGWELIRFQ